MEAILRPGGSQRPGQSVRGRATLTGSRRPVPALPVARGPRSDEQGHLVQWFGTDTDIEDRRRAEEALRDAQAELAHVSRLTTMGELTASLAHELNQPLAAVVTNGSACLRWLDRAEPNLAEAMNAVQRIIRDADRAADVIAHTRALLKKSGGEKALLDITEVIREVLAPRPARGAATPDRDPRVARGARTSPPSWATGSSSSRCCST